MNWYLYFSTATFLLLAVIWKKEDWPNTFLKVAFIILTVCGAFFSLLQSGYVVKH